MRFKTKSKLIAIVIGFAFCPAFGQGIETKEIMFKPADANSQAFRDHVVSLVNSERAKETTAAIQSNANLTRLAQTFADDMVARHFFNHVDPDGNTCKERARKLKVASPQAESILAGVLTGEEAVEEFMSDPPRAQNSSRANILNPEFRFLGVGVAQKPSGTLVVVLEFAKK